MTNSGRHAIAHEIVMGSPRYDGSPVNRLVEQYLAFPCHLCGKPMAGEPGECHGKCVAEEQADRPDDREHEIQF